MRVLIQWSRSQPSDWEAIDSSEWGAMPKRVARGNRVARFDGDRGWINALCVQGVVFQGDAYAVTHEKDGCGVWVRDDGIYRYVRFYPLARDPNLAGAMNTRQHQTIFTDQKISQAQQMTLLPYADAFAPEETVWREGVLMPDGLYAAHVKHRATRGWREWTEGVDQLFLQNGRVRPQRAMGLYIVPKGTRTYYMSTAAIAQTVHTADSSRQLTVLPGGIGTYTTPSINTNGQTVLAGYTPAGEPNHAQWPTGDYRYQIDILSANSDLTYGVLDLGSQGIGHFGRVNAALSAELESKQQSQAAFSLVGLKLATTGSVSWAAGAASERFEVAVAADKSTGMGTSTMTFELGESDDFADGPWAAAAQGQNAAMLGHNF